MPATSSYSGGLYQVPSLRRLAWNQADFYLCVLAQGNGSPLTLYIFRYLYAECRLSPAMAEHDYAWSASIREFMMRSVIPEDEGDYPITMYSVYGSGDGGELDITYSDNEEYTDDEEPWG